VLATKTNIIIRLSFMEAKWGYINMVLLSTSLGTRKSCHFLNVTACSVVIGLSTQQLRGEASLV